MISAYMAGEDVADELLQACRENPQLLKELADLAVIERLLTFCDENESSDCFVAEVRERLESRQGDAFVESVRGRLKNGSGIKCFCLFSSRLRP